MNVNKFGGGMPSMAMKKKNENQSLIRNITTKVSKNGDVMTGNLEFKIPGEGMNEIKIGVFDDLQQNQSVCWVFGGYNNQLKCTHDRKIKLATLTGIEISNDKGKICQFGEKTVKDGNDLITRFYGKILMKNNHISELRDPSGLQDAATKSYVDRRRVKNNIGFLNFRNFFNNNAPDQVENPFSITYTTSWPVMIWAVVFRGLDNPARWYKWDILASDDKIKWDTLHKAQDEEIGPSNLKIDIDCKGKEYQHFQFAGHERNGPDPRRWVIDFQIYTLDKIV